MKITLSTPHGNFKISKWTVRQSLRDLCIQNQIPFQSVSFYGCQKENLSLIVGLYKPISELAPSFEEILIKVDRNIDYAKLVQKFTKLRPNDNAVSEYTFPSGDSEEFHHFELSQEECQK